MHLFLLLNFKFTVWPEMILFPWLLSHNFELYKNIILPYFPFLPYFLEFSYFLLGYSVTSLKIISFSIFLITDILIFLFSGKLTQKLNLSVPITLTYIFLQISLLGNGLWLDHFVAPILFLSMLLIYTSRKTNSIFIAGILFGLAVLTKQNSIFFALPALFLLMKNKDWKKVPYFFAPLVIFLGLLLLFVFYKQTLAEFFEWAVILPLSFPKQPGFVVLPTLKQSLFIISMFTPLIFLRKRNLIFWSLCFACATIFAFSRFEDFHLQVLITFFAICLVYLKKEYIFGVLTLSFVLLILTQGQFWHKEDQFIDPPTFQLANQIKNYDSVYLLINNLELSYFFADKLPPKVWATDFPWYFESGNLQQKLIDDLELEKTHYIILGKPLRSDNFNINYDFGSYLPPKMRSYIDQNYEFVKEENGLQVWVRK
jgi:hypothetical protein